MAGGLAQRIALLGACASWTTCGWSSSGLILGTVAAYFLTRLMGSGLYGVPPTDPLTFVAVLAVLLLVAALACLLPARRATAINPMIALSAS